MKKIRLVFFAPLLVVCLFSCSVLNGSAKPANRLAWAGIYTGQIPAADRPGINAEITLNADHTYRVIYRYIDGDSFVYIGNFGWDKTGSKITLSSREIPSQYMIEENTLIQLDMNGNRITGAHADKYIFRKQQ